MTKPTTRVEPAGQGGWNIVVNDQPSRWHPHDESLVEALSWAFGDDWVDVALNDGRHVGYVGSSFDDPITVEPLERTSDTINQTFTIVRDQIAYFYRHD